MSYMYDSTALGQFGSLVLIGGDSTSTNVAAIQCISDATFDTLAARDSNMNLFDNAHEGITIPAGTVLYGRFYSIEVASGTVVCYTNGIK